MIWIVAFILLAVIVWLSFGGNSEFTEKKAVYNLLQEHDPTFWRLLKDVKDSQSMDELNYVCKAYSDAIGWYLKALRTSEYGEKVAENRENEYKEAVNEAIMRLTPEKTE